MARDAKTSLRIFAVVASLLIVAWVIWLTENLISGDETANNIQTGFQFYTSSWPAQWPDVLDRRSFWFALGVLFRFSLIVSPTLFTFGLLWEFYKVRERTMRVIDALKLRDNAIEVAFLRDIPEAQKETARKKLRESIKTGTQEWMRWPAPQFPASYK